MAAYSTSHGTATYRHCNLTVPGSSSSLLRPLWDSIHCCTLSLHPKEILTLGNRIGVTNKITSIGDNFGVLCNTRSEWRSLLVIVINSGYLEAPSEELEPEGTPSLPPFPFDTEPFTSGNDLLDVHPEEDLCPPVHCSSEYT
jgi:hypothetical protein